jgi:TBC1 domain family member 20
VELRTDCSIGPLLLGCNGGEDMFAKVEELPQHRDEDQVELDVHRSFVYYPEGIP